MSRSRSTAFAMIPFDGKNLRNTPTQFSSNSHRFTIRRQMSKSARDPHIFALALTVSEIFTFKIVDLHKVGQGHGVQFLR